MRLSSILATSGCVAYWRSRTAGLDGRRRIAANPRLTEPDPIARVPIDPFDGLDTFTTFHEMANVWQIIGFGSHGARSEAPVLVLILQSKGADYEELPGRLPRHRRRHVRVE